MNPSQKRKVAILVFDEVEVLDFCGPLEVFSVANRFSAEPAFDVILVAETTGTPITTRGGMSVNPDQCIKTVDEVNVLLIPGGIGTRRLLKSKMLLNWIRDIGSSAELVLSVCTGALLLGAAGMLKDVDATTHRDAIDELKAVAPTARVLTKSRFVDNGKLITSAGISAGIDMSFHVVGRLLGDDVATATARQMEYEWAGQRT